MKRRAIINNLISSVTVITVGYFVMTCTPPKKQEPIAFIDRILPAPKGGGYEDPDYWVWGSSVTKGEDGKYHMFASRWLKRLGFGKWVTNSEVVHAVADTPAGPYKTCECRPATTWQRTLGWHVYPQSKGGKIQGQVFTLLFWEYLRFQKTNR